MRNVLFILVIVWFVLGVSVANDRGFFDTNADRTCTSSKHSRSNPAR